MTQLTRDGLLLFANRCLRMLTLGCLAVVLPLYLAELGLSAARIGMLLSATMAGGATTTALVGVVADRWGRRRMLVLSCLALSASSVVLAMTANFWLLLGVAALGALILTGQDLGPYQSLEQAALAQSLPAESHMRAFAWYNLTAAAAGALGALLAGGVPTWLAARGWAPLAAQQALLWTAAVAGLAMAGLSAALSPAVEVSGSQGGPGGTRNESMPRAGLHRSRRIVIRLSLLFGVDSLAGGLAVQSLLAYWLSQRFGVGLSQLGPLFFATNLLTALSFLVAARIAGRIGLLNTMVFTHLPANALLALLPLAPSWPVAVILLLVRHTLAQMDVPARQAYTMAVVAPEERSAAAGFTNAVRAGAGSVAPAIAGLAMGTAVAGLPFVVAGVLKAAYDVALWQMFRGVPLPGQASARAIR